MRDGVIVSDCDPSTVRLVNINIRKEEEGPDSRVFEVGDDVPFDWTWAWIELYEKRGGRWVRVGNVSSQKRTAARPS